MAARKPTAAADPAAEILGGGWDADAALVKSMDTLNGYLGVMDEVDKQRIGHWIHRPEYREKLRGWHFYRCGLRNSPFAQEAAQRLRQTGWVDAPPGSFMRGCEGDGEGGLNLCCPPESYRKYKAAQKALEQRRHGMLERSFGSGVEQLANMRGVQVTRNDGKASELTADEYRALVGGR